MARRIDHGDGVEEDLHQSEHEEAAAGVAGIHGRQLVGIVVRQQMQRLAQIVDEDGKGSLRGEGLRIAAGAVVVQPPGLFRRLLRPEIALGARHPRIALIADPEAGEPCGFVPDAGKRRPFEGVAAPGAMGEMVLAEGDAGELDPGFERVAIDLQRR